MKSTVCKNNTALRKATNQRERRRTTKMNVAFERLRKRVPTFGHETRLSKIDVLRLAIMYIHFMRKLLADTQ